MKGKRGEKKGREKRRGERGRKRGGMYKCECIDAHEG